MTLPAGGRAEYADAVVYLKTPSGTVRVRRAPGSWTTGEFPGPPGQAVHVITAHNPGGAGREQAANAAAQASLEAELTRRELQWWPAAGGDPAWVHVEPSAAVIGLNRGQALELGRQYGQDAVFELTPGSRLIVSCHDGTVTSTGWSIDALDDGHPESDRAAERPSSGPSASDASPDRAAPGQQPHQQEAPSSPYPPDWLAPGGFLAALGHREGTLMSLTADGQTLMIRGHGDGLVTLGGPGDDPAEPCTIAEVMGLLAERGTFDPDPGGDWRYASGGWDAGEVAAVIAPWHDLNGGGATEFAVDGIEMRTDGYASPIRRIPQKPRR